jgi:hypothetical protein
MSPLRGWVLIVLSVILIFTGAVTNRTYKVSLHPSEIYQSSIVSWAREHPSKTLRQRW